jgi:ribonuclease P protein component
VYALRSTDTAAGFVARREVGGAVARNRARRLLREAWRQVEPAVATPVEVVFVARPSIADSRMPEVAQEMRALLAREGAIES